MQTVSQAYADLLAADARREVKAVIDGVTYGEETLVSVKTSVSLMQTLAIGNAVAAQIDLAIWNPGQIARMAQIALYVRLDDGTTQSEWLPQGVFYIDTRDFDEETDVLTVHGFDAMLKADQPYFQGGAVGVWPRAANVVVSDICARMGVTLSADTSISTTNMVEFPNDYTMREVLSHVAAAQGGNWYITDAGELRLLPLTGTGSVSALGLNVGELDTSPALPGISRVTLYYDDTNAFTAGNDTGYALEADCPWATQGITNALLTNLTGYVYRPFAATDALIDPAAELGDGAIIDGVTYPIMQMDTTFDALYTADIGAPQEKTIDHEYPYLTPTQRALQRKVTLGANYYGATITRANGLKIMRSDGTSEATFNSNQFTMSALIDGVMIPRIFFDAVKGDFVFNGALGADAVFTDSLYAETGDVAELTVDRLSTSRRIRLYNLQNTADDNYITIKDQHMQFVSGVVKMNNGEPLTEQAVNRNGSPLYWQRQPVSYTADGYPLDADGVQIYATTDVTSWPVTQYQYDDYIKAEYAFDLINGQYVPTLTFGVGYGLQDADRGKGFIRKNPDGFDMWLLDHNGNQRGIFVSDTQADPYTHIVGLPRPTEINFSDFDNGSFTVSADDGTTATYSVAFDGSGNPAEITAPDGHRTVVRL